MRSALAILALLSLQDREESFFERMRFAEANPETEAGRRVNALLREKRHWVAAHRAIEARLGPMREGVDLSVTFDYDGEEVAKAASKGRTGQIRFNLSRLESYQAKLDEFEAKKKEAEAQGARLVFKVVPARIDRVIWHELTHIFHADYDAPEWFTEGLAQWLSEDLNALQSFAHKGREVGPIEAPPEERNDVYGRGHLFWSWIAERGAVKRVVRATVLDGAPWKAGLEKSLGLSWATIRDVEREWSARQIGRLRRP